MSVYCTPPPGNSAWIRAITSGGVAITRSVSPVISSALM